MAVKKTTKTKANGNGAGANGTPATTAQRLGTILKASRDIMRDARIVSAGLDKGCTARDFYSGFYVARTGDGMMCTGRDKLQSRNGANCKLGKLKQLVASN